jgi:putative endonuclease
MNSNKYTGNKGEELAAAYLVQRGFTIIAQNWRFRHCEADIIASKNKMLHFFEVKTRTSGKFGKPEESISFAKMECLRNVAEEYQYQHPEWQYIQFDVIAITLQYGEPVEYFLIEDVYF